jgi:serine/threonine protein kinase
MTCQGQIMGTIDYLAPEQADDARQATAASDIYSLGATGIFLLSGQPPFPDSKFPTMLSKLKAHAIEHPPWLVDNSHHLHAAIVRILSKCLAKRPSERYTNCEALCLELERYADADELSNWLNLKTSPSMGPQPSTCCPTMRWSRLRFARHSRATAVAALVGCLSLPLLSLAIRNSWTSLTSAASTAKVASIASQTNNVTDNAPLINVAGSQSAGDSQPATTNESQANDDPAITKPDAASIVQPNMASDTNEPTASDPGNGKENRTGAGSPVRKTLSNEGRSFSASPARIPKASQGPQNSNKPFSNALRETP